MLVAAMPVPRAASLGIAHLVGQQVCVRFASSLASRKRCVLVRLTLCGDASISAGGLSRAGASLAHVRGPRGPCRPLLILQANLSAVRLFFLQTPPFTLAPRSRFALRPLWCSPCRISRVDLVQALNGAASRAPTRVCLRYLFLQGRDIASTLHARIMFDNPADRNFGR